MRKVSHKTTKCTSFYDFFYTSETEGSSSGRRLYVQVWHSLHAKGISTLADLYKTDLSNRPT